ncbi:MAG: hypothetical protein ABS49_05985 [Erythrobacter sp. SCN 62-14]|nr:MAG: hypothetical protein ABS49_05985 [Erythrobacter sp. SCN 62-14]
MCGLYSILNFLSTLDEWKDEEPAKALEYVLEAAEAEGVLTARWITGGYRSSELKGILNRIFQRWWMPFEAFFLCEIERLPGEQTHGLYCRILECGGAVIGGSDDRSHWLLFSKVEGTQSIIDSSDNVNPVRRFDGRSRTFCSDDAIVILARSRATFQIG